MEDRGGTATPQLPEEGGTDEQGHTQADVANAEAVLSDVARTEGDGTGGDDRLLLALAKGKGAVDEAARLALWADLQAELQAAI